MIADMQKFPLRMKDNDLLVTELYRDPSCDPITAISVYLTPKTSKLFFYAYPCLNVANLASNKIQKSEVKFSKLMVASYH